MSITVVGTMAYDAIKTPFGQTDKIIGGAATYIAYSAANFYTPINMVSIVGGDFDKNEMKNLESIGANLDGVEIKEDGKSFFWSGEYHLDMNTRDTLVTDLNVLMDFNPVLPEDYRKNTKYLLLGNIDPVLQLNVINQMENKPDLIVLDTMNFWMDTAMDKLKEVISKVDVLTINDSEARQLADEYSLVKAAKKILKMGPKYLIIKKGENGALLFDNENIFFAPALPLEEVFDPTGAGDTFAGGFVGYLAETGNVSFENMKRAIIYGSAMASFCVEKFGTERLKEVKMEDIRDRIAQFVSLSAFDISFE